MNTVILFMNIMRFITFSSKLSMFYEILMKSFKDILLFIIMFIMILITYAVMGHLMFGHMDASFKSLGD